MIGLEKATGLDSIITLICYLAFATKTHSLIEEKKFQNVFFLAKEYFSTAYCCKTWARKWTSNPSNWKIVM